jgi:hypothetical protein
MNKSEIQSQALNQMGEFIKKYGDAFFQISQNKSMNMRFLRDLVRENYFGVFKKDKDLIGQFKIFYPLTETLVWENVKNIDIDTKDVNTKANNPNMYGLAVIVRNMMRDWMEKQQFGEQINDDLMYFALDGHIVNKKILSFDEFSKKKTIKFERVDLRNIFKDQAVGSLQTSDFIERSVQDVSYIKEEYKGRWINLDKLVGSNSVATIYNEDKQESSNSPECEIFTGWMKIPYSWISGKQSDNDYWINGKVIASGLINGTPLIHRIEEWNKVRPYEEAKFEEAPGRWQGRGIGEKALYLQIYLNTIYNVRRNNNLALMNQLFQFKEGTGITPEKMAKLFAGGAIGVQTVGDIARIDTRNINFNESITEEQNVVSVANRLGSSQEAATGEALPSSTPATNAIIQAKAVKTSFQLRQERFGLFLSNMFKRQWLPDVYKIYSKDEILRLVGEEDQSKLKRKLTKYYTDKTIAESANQITPQQADAIGETVKKQLDEKEELFVSIEDLKDADKIDVSFYITDETFDKATVLQNLQQVLTSYKQFASDPNSMVILRNILDILGLDSESLMANMEQVAQPTMGEQAPESKQEGEQTPDGLVESQTNRVDGQITNA